MKRPNLFIAGAPKCGTTAIYRYLEGHPDIFFPKIKEPNYFADDLAILSYPEIDSLEAYLSLYQESSGEPVLGDASQFHLYSTNAAGRIKEFAPEARIIIMLREPISMMKSLHSQYIETGDEDELRFYKAVQLEGQRKAGHSLPAHSLFPRCMTYIDMATFSPQVERYYTAFGRDAVKIILLDDLRDDAHAVYLDLLAFLNVSTKRVPLLVPYNSARESNDIPEQLRRHLNARVEKDIGRLEALIGRDLSAWRLPRLP